MRVLFHTKLALALAHAITSTLRDEQVINMSWNYGVETTLFSNSCCIITRMCFFFQRSCASSVRRVVSLRIRRMSLCEHAAVGMVWAGICLGSSCGSIATCCLRLGRRFLSSSAARHCGESLETDSDAKLLKSHRSCQRTLSVIISYCKENHMTWLSHTFRTLDAVFLFRQYHNSVRWW